MPASKYGLAQYAVLAALGIFAAGAAPAQAADLGGNCCADLEERVAELEATTARKGNRKVSLTVYGQVNKAIVWHDSDRPESRVEKGVPRREERFERHGDVERSGHCTYD